MVLIEEIKVRWVSALFPSADGFDEHLLWTLSVSVGITTTAEFGPAGKRKEEQETKLSAW